jgi:cytochrome c
MFGVQRFVFIMALGVSASAYADLNLVKDKQCLQCHAVNKELIGPSFKRIAFRWKGNPAAEQLLISTIQQGSREGGGQHWSSLTNMPDSSERPLVSHEEARQIVKWIMGL